MESHAPAKLAIDPDAPKPDLHLFAAMTFPGDKRDRDAAVAVMLALELGELKRVGHNSAVTWVEHALGEAAAARGRATSAVKAMPHGSHFISETASLFLADVRKDSEDALAYVGGYGTLALARVGGIDHVTECMTRVARQSKFVGGALLLVASMVLHHSDIEPSINRAWSVMASGRDAGVYDVPSDLRTFRRDWSKSRCVAPLFAAYWLYNHQMSTYFGLRRDEIQRALRSGEGVRTIVGWAKWLRAWAVEFSPKHGAGPLIPDSEAAVYDSSAPELAPRLEGLGDVQLEAARAAPSRFS